MNTSANARNHDIAKSNESNYAYLFNDTSAFQLAPIIEDIICNENIKTINL